jgi:hypothetical protein
MVASARHIPHLMNLAIYRTEPAEKASSSSFLVLPPRKIAHGRDKPAQYIASLLLKTSIETRAWLADKQGTSGNL